MKFIDLPQSDDLDALTTGETGDGRRNTKGLADHLELEDADRTEYCAAISKWLGQKVEA